MHCDALSLSKRACRNGRREKTKNEGAERCTERSRSAAKRVKEEEEEVMSDE